jgi:hypothetical protein
MAVKIITEGDRLLKTDITHNNFRVDGSGIKIGIISDSFNAKDSLTSDIANGELPGANNPAGKFQPIQVLKDLKSDNVLANEESRALAQIIHDRDPGADLLFHTFIGDSDNLVDRNYSEAVNSLVAAGVGLPQADLAVAQAQAISGKIGYDNDWHSLGLRL